MKLTNVLIALAFGCSLALAQVPGGTDTRPATDSIKTQIKNLDNDSFDVRTKAMEDLRAAGESARADLEAAKKSDSLEVRTRAETLLKELDDKKSGVVRSGGLRPVLPGEETPRGPETVHRPRRRGPAPRGLSRTRTRTPTPSTSGWMSAAGPAFRRSSCPTARSSTRTSRSSAPGR